MRCGRLRFPEFSYDPPGDVLYARISLADTARREQSPEGDTWTFDADGRPSGVIVMEPRARFERDGAVFITLPSGERERLQGIESAIRASTPR